MSTPCKLVSKGFNSTKLLTLCSIIDFSSSKILLGYKKRGFGAGYYNGFGGKVQKDESIIDCAIRECKEDTSTL